MIILKIRCFKLKKVTLHAFRGKAAAPSDPDGCQDWDPGSSGTFQAENEPSEGAQVGMHSRRAGRRWLCQVARNAAGGTAEMHWDIQLLVHRV